MESEEKGGHFLRAGVDRRPSWKARSPEQAGRYVCDVCGKEVASPQGLQKHKTQKHTDRNGAVEAKDVVRPLPPQIDLMGYDRQEGKGSNTEWCPEQKDSQSSLTMLNELAQKYIVGRKNGERMQEEDGKLQQAARGMRYDESTKRVPQPCMEPMQEMVGSIFGEYAYAKNHNAGGVESALMELLNVPEYFQHLPGQKRLRAVVLTRRLKEHAQMEYDNRAREGEHNQRVHTKEEKNVLKAVELVREGEIGKAARVLWSNGVADVTPPVLEQISGSIGSKRPSAFPPLPADLPTTVFTPDGNFRRTMKAICRKKTVQGLWGWTFAMVAATLANASCLRGWAMFMSDIVNGSVLPKRIVDRLMATRVIPLLNSDPGAAVLKVRCVEICDTFLSIAQQLVGGSMRRFLSTTLGQYQMALGTSGGGTAEAVIAQLCSLAGAYGYSSDFVNAFGSCNNGVILDLLGRAIVDFPQYALVIKRIAKLVWSMLQFPRAAVLHGGDAIHIFRHYDGLPQGDYLSASLCCIFLHPLYKHARLSIAGHNLQLAYIDDVNGFAQRAIDVACGVQGLRTAADIFKQSVHKIQVTQLVKSTTETEREVNEALGQVGCVDVHVKIEHELTVVNGIPIGRTPERESQALTESKYFRKIRKICLLLKHPLMSRQCALAILRVVVCPSVTHFVKGVFPSVGALFLKEFRRQVEGVLAHVMCVHKDDLYRDELAVCQYGLPIAKGGLGLGMFWLGEEEMAQHAWFSAFASASGVEGALTPENLDVYNSPRFHEELKRTTERIRNVHGEQIRRLIPQGTTAECVAQLRRQMLSSNADTKKQTMHLMTTLQRAYVSVCCEKLDVRWNGEIAGGDDRRRMIAETQRARLLGCTSFGAYLVLSVVPVDDVQQIPEQAFTLAVRLRCGFPPYPSTFHKLLPPALMPPLPPLPLPPPLLPNAPPLAAAAMPHNADARLQCPHDLKDLGHPTHPYHCTLCNAERIAGHNAIARVLERHLVQIAGRHNVTMEVPIMGQVDRDEPCADVKCSFGEEQIAVDVTVGDAMCPSYVRQSAQGRLATAARLAAAKRRHYADQLQGSPAVLYPFALETLGGFGVDAQKFLDWMVVKAGHNQGQSGEALKRVVMLEITRQLCIRNWEMAKKADSLRRL